MARVLAVVVAAGLFIEHRLDGQNDVNHRAEQHGHHITVVVLIHLFDITPGAFDFDLAHQAVRTVAIIGSEGLPAVDGHAAQSAVGALAEHLVAFGLPDDVFKIFPHGDQIQLIEHIGHNVGTKCFHVGCRVPADQLLKVAIKSCAKLSITPFNVANQPLGFVFNR